MFCVFQNTGPEGFSRVNKLATAYANHSVGVYVWKEKAQMVRRRKQRANGRTDCAFGKKNG